MIEQIEHLRVCPLALWASIMENVFIAFVQMKINFDTGTPS
jgi:hypothetical protein